MMLQRIFTLTGRKLVALGALWAAAANLWAANVSLTWDANTDPALAGYRILYGTASRTYTAQIPVGPTATNQLVTSLPPGTTHYFAIIATNSAGAQTDLSPEVVLTTLNQVPVANAQSVTTLEDTARAITLTGSDADGSSLTYAVLTSPTKGTLSGSAPNLTYTPNANANGADSFTFRVNDGLTNSAAATVSVTITPVNDRPVANAQSVTTLEDTAKAITLSGSDVDGDTLTFAIVTAPTKGTFSGTAPNLTYTPNANANGSDSFTFRVNDGATNSANATVSITITPVNDAPIANAQSVTTLEDTAIAITLSGSDADANSLTYAVQTSPTKGVLSGTAPNLTYTPTANANGSDSFTFRVNDGTTNSAAATVSLTISPVNDAPVANAQSVTTLENVAAAITLSGSDADGDALTFAIVGSPTKGTLSGTAPNLTYTPNANANGSDSFTFRVNDGTTNSAAATVTIAITAVNNAPVANAQSITTPEDAASPVTLTGSDTDGDPLTFAIVASPTKGVLSGTAPNLTYTPNANANGNDSFTFRVNDGLTNSASATVSLTITPVNDAPIANAQSVTTLEDTAKPITLSGSDVDGDTLTFAVVAAPTKGTLSGTAPNLTYTPNANANGNDSFTFRVNDGLTNSANATVSITITPVNDAPIANAQSVTTLEDTAIAITLSGSDADANSLTYAVQTSPTKGTLSGTAPNLTYTPSANANGSDSFTFRVNDGTTNSAAATVAISITPVNDAPVANALSGSVVAGQSLSLALTGSDVDNDPLTFVIVSSPAQGTLSGTPPNVTYTANAGTSGTDSFTFRVNDGTADSAPATVSITVLASPNVAPTAFAAAYTNAEDAALALTLTGSDPEAATLTFNLLAAPTNGVLTGTAPNLTYTPNTNFNGADSFTFNVSDGLTNSAAATVALTITAANDAPVADAQSITTPEDTAKSITLSGSDVEGDALTFAIVTSPSKGTLSGTAPNLTYVPNANATGADSFTFHVNDGTTNSTAATVSLTLTPANDAPIANAQSVTTPEDTAKAITLTGSDADGDALTYSIVAAPTKGALSGTAPNLTYTPNANANGSDSFTFRVNDGLANSPTATVSLTITPVNDRPIANAQSVTTLEDTAKAITLTGSDVDGDALTYSIVAAPTKGVLSGSAPNLTYTPNANANGSDSFTFRVNDGFTNSATATVSLTVTPVNDRPIANGQSVTTPEDTAKTITLTGSDVDGDALTYSIMAAPTKGVLSGTAPNLTYTPNANANGSDSFTFRVNDGLTNSTVATVSLTIAPANDAPTALAQSLSLTRNTSLPLVLTGSDVDGDALTFTVVAAPANGTLTGTAPNFTYIPATNFVGADSFTFRANDGSTNSPIATIALNVLAGANTPPVANAQSVAATEDTAKAITLAGSDADGDSLTFTVVSAPANGTLSGTAPNLTYTPNPNFNGADSFTFRVSDAATNSPAATVAITVAAVNDAPTLAVLPGVVLVQNSAAQSINLSGISSGAPNENDSLSVTTVSGDTGLVTVSALTYTSPAATGSFQLTPVANASGSAFITVTVNDGGASNATVVRTFSVTVSPNTAVPDITLLSPTNDAAFNAPASVWLEASVTNNGQTIQRVQFWADTNLVAEVTNAPYQATWLWDDGQTNHTIVARAIYSGGSLWVDSAPVSIGLDPLPAPWEPATIGALPVSGTAVVTNETYVVSGAGLLAGTKDTFQFVAQPLLGDGSIIFRLDSTQATNRNARIGIMIRESLNANSRYAFIGVSPDGLIRAQTRSTTGGATSSSYVNPRTGAPKNVWLRIKRTGSNVEASRSANGTSWSRLKAARINMAPNILMGLSVASGSTNVLDTACFSSPTVQP